MVFLLKFTKQGSAMNDNQKLAGTLKGRDNLLNTYFETLSRTNIDIPCDLHEDQEK